MKMAKAPSEHIDRLIKWLQFNDELSQIDPTDKEQWEDFKDDWDLDKDFSIFIKECELDGKFNLEYYFDYYHSNISHIHMRIIFGYETLLDNCCDPDKDYLDFNEDIKKAFDNLERND